MPLPHFMGRFAHHRVRTGASGGSTAFIGAALAERSNHGALFAATTHVSPLGLSANTATQRLPVAVSTSTASPAGTLRWKTSLPLSPSENSSAGSLVTLATVSFTGAGGRTGTRGMGAVERSIGEDMFEGLA